MCLFVVCISHEQSGSLPRWLGLQNTPTAPLQRGKIPCRVSWYGTKKSDGKVPVMLELWGMRSTPSLPMLRGLPWPIVGALNRVLSMGQIELICVLMLNRFAWNNTILTFKLYTNAKLICSK